MGVGDGIVMFDVLCLIVCDIGVEFGQCSVGVGVVLFGEEEGIGELDYVGYQYQYEQNECEVV